MWIEASSYRPVRPQSELVSRIMSLVEGADSGSDSTSTSSRGVQMRRPKKFAPAPRDDDGQQPYSIDPMSFKPLSHALPLPLPILLLPLLLLFLLVIMVLLPPSVMTSASRAVHALRAASVGLTHLALSEANAT